MALSIHEAAADEAVSARDWYEVQRPGLGDNFTSVLLTELVAIEGQPLRWPADKNGFRRHVMHRFPYSIFYRVTDIEVRIVALAHQKRRPGYWNERR